MVCRVRPTLRLGHGRHTTLGVPGYQRCARPWLDVRGASERRAKRKARGDARGARGRGGPAAREGARRAHGRARHALARRERRPVGPRGLTRAGQAPRCASKAPSLVTLRQGLRHTPSTRLNGERYRCERCLESWVIAVTAHPARGCPPATTAAGRRGSHRAGSRARRARRACRGRTRRPPQARSPSRCTHAAGLGR